jgi:hypothetical protein
MSPEHPLSFRSLLQNLQWEKSLTMREMRKNILLEVMKERLWWFMRLFYWKDGVRFRRGTK